MKKNSSLTFISICIYIVILLLLPKNISIIFGNFPIRTSLIYILFIIFIYDKFKNKIELNNINFKWFGITYGLFLVCTIPSIFVTKNLVTTIYTLIKFISFILLLYICIKTKLTKEEYKKIIKLIIILSTIKFIWGIIEYIFEIDLFTVGSYKYPGSKGRVRAFFFNTIYYGVYINLIFAYIYYLFNKVTSKKKKIILGIISLLAFTNMLLTFTRSTFLVFFGIIFLLFIFLNKKIINKRTICLILICIMTAFTIPGGDILMLSSINDITKMVLKYSPFEKLLPDEATEADKDALMGDYSIAHRKLFAETGIVIGKDNLITGIGFGSYIDYIETSEFTQKYPKYSEVKTHPHSSYVLMFSEVGILAVIAFTSFIVTIFIKIIDIIKNNKKTKDIAIVTLCITIGFYIVNIVAENIFYDTQIFPMYLLILGLLLGYNEIKENKVIK